MKAEDVFKKAAVKLDMKYLGKAREGRYIFGYFESSEGSTFRSFYFPSIRDVVGAINDQLSKARKMSECK